MSSIIPTTIIPKMAISQEELRLITKRAKEDKVILERRQLAVDKVDADLLLRDFLVKVSPKFKELALQGLNSLTVDSDKYFTYDEFSKIQRASCGICFKIDGFKLELKHGFVIIYW